MDGIGNQGTQSKRHADPGPDDEDEHHRGHDDHSVRDIDRQIDSARIHRPYTPRSRFIPYRSGLGINTLSD
jgi:hypothetical protein